LLAYRTHGENIAVLLLHEKKLHHRARFRRAVDRENIDTDEWERSRSRLPHVTMRSCCKPAKA
jgi:hypothetical protein